MFALDYEGLRAWITLGPSVSQTPASFEAPALKTGSDRVTYDVRMLVDKTAKRLDSRNGDRLVMTFIQAPGDLVEIPSQGE